MLVKTISHELRIPISIIKGYSDILSEGLVEDEESKEKYLKKINEKANHLTELVSSMVLEMEKNFEGNHHKQVAKCDLVKVVEGVAEDFSLVAEKKQIAIHVQHSDAFTYVFCDQVRLTQVISNIVNNSVKYMGKSGNIQMSLGYLEKDEVTLIIRDNGERMDHEAASEIFETSQGLGRKISKETVESYKGSIWCKSEKDKGMAVYIALPAKEKI